MKLPRDMDAPDLIKALQRLGYRVARQTGSHVRLQCETPKHHVLTNPNHSPLELGTLAAILIDVADQRGLSKWDLLELIDA